MNEKKETQKMTKEECLTEIDHFIGSIFTEMRDINTKSKGGNNEN